MPMYFNMLFKTETSIFNLKKMKNLNLIGTHGEIIIVYSPRGD